MNWTENYSICESNGAKLISIDSDVENSFLKDLVESSVPTVGRYDDFMIKKIIFLGIFSQSIKITAMVKLMTILGFW